MLEIRDRVAGLAMRKASNIAASLGHDARVVKWTRSTYGAVLNFIAAERGVNWSINGVNYRIDMRYRSQMAHEYESPVAEFLRKVVKPGFVCFDVGANVGVYVLQLCHWSGPSGRVIAFEPNPEARITLQRHVLMNGLRNRVRTVPLALGSADRHSRFFAAGADGMSRMDMPNPLLANQSHELDVPVTTLDGFVQAGRIAPDVVLIDVEGFELEVLLGAQETIRAKRGAIHVVMEIHPSLWSPRTRNRMSDLLNELELRPRCLTGQRDPLAEYGLVYLEPSRGGHLD
jgi:FkbM family methyltransferase